MLDDYKLSQHFTFYELTKTNNLALQEENRTQAIYQRNKLELVAELLEGIRSVTGPLEIHSGFRCKALNALTKGSSGRSQHMLAEAADFSTPGADTPESIQALFHSCINTLIEKKMMFGQIIKESAAREYGRVYWVHLSLGAPWREIARCGQVLEMLDGKYTLIDTVKVS